MSDLKILADVRVWGDMDRIHKMGWLRAGDIIRIENMYKNWRRFIPYIGCADLLPVSDLYPSYFVNVMDITASMPFPEEQTEPEPPILVTDAELGAALKLILRAIREA